MALNQLEIATINRAMNLAKKVLEEVRPVADLLDILYNASGGVGSTVDQADLDARPELSGLTKQELDDGVFPLTGAVRTAINNATTALSKLAARVPY